ncbi:hypothetical protein BVRB_018900, partial [Beta vulgaris subsp. vulgaris]
MVDISDVVFDAAKQRLVRELVNRKDPLSTPGASSDHAADEPAPGDQSDEESLSAAIAAARDSLGRWPPEYETDQWKHQDILWDLRCRLYRADPSKIDVVAQHREVLKSSCEESNLAFLAYSCAACYRPFQHNNYLRDHVSSAHQFLWKLHKKRYGLGYFRARNLPNPAVRPGSWTSSACEMDRDPPDIHDILKKVQLCCQTLGIAEEEIVQQQVPLDDFQRGLVERALFYYQNRYYGAERCVDKDMLAAHLQRNPLRLQDEIAAVCAICMKPWASKHNCLIHIGIAPSHSRKRTREGTSRPTTCDAVGHQAVLQEFCKQYFESTGTYLTVEKVVEEFVIER